MNAMTMKELASLTQGTILCGENTRQIDGFCTDSRMGGKNKVFLPLIGEHVDAHEFILDAYKHGMRATLTSRTTIVSGTEEMTYLAVDNTLFALQRAAGAYRSRFLIPVIGITGSVGKTTTKEMAAAALSGEKNVLKTQGNKNGQIGLPQMMFELSSEHELALIEMGMSLPGEMQRLVEIAKPQVAVVSNIGVAHIGQLKSQEKIRREKLMIINEFPNDGLLLLNGDDPLLWEIYEAKKLWENAEASAFDTFDLSEKTKDVLMHCKIATYGTNPNCDFKASALHPLSKGIGTEFTFESTYEGTQWKEQICLHVPGVHNVLNALAALALAFWFGVSIKSAKQGLAAYQPPAMRGTIEQIGTLTIIDDCYNASPDSMKGGIQVLCGLPFAKRRVAVLGDILELGELSEQFHREVGTYIANCPVELLVTVGAEARFLAEEAMRQGKPSEQILCCRDRQEASQILPGLLQEGDAVFIKASRGMQLEELVQKIKELF